MVKLEEQQEPVVNNSQDRAVAIQSGREDLPLRHKEELIDRGSSVEGERRPSDR